MPDKTLSARPIVMLVMIISALSLALLAGLIYAGVVPLPEESRAVAALVVGVAAAADFLVALWFFRAGQSS